MHITNWGTDYKVAVSFRRCIKMQPFSTEQPGRLELPLGLAHNLLALLKEVVLDLLSLLGDKRAQNVELNLDLVELGGGKRGRCEEVGKAAGQ